MEQRLETKTYVIIQKCDKCREGKMMVDENNMLTLLTSYPPLYPHKCDKCGHEENYNVVYPYQQIEYEEVNYE